MTGTKKIALLGTFDVDNYGDLLFPFIAEHRLSNFDLDYVSPTKKETIFQDAKKIISYKDFLNNKYDGVLIGGGNILHLMPNKNTVYNGFEGFSYADLWIGAVKYAQNQKIPSCFNAPGISKKITNEKEQRIVNQTFNSSNYVSLRERFSKEILSDFILDTNFINVVPDTALEISEMWKFDDLKKKNKLTINLNQRYHRNIEDSAKWIDKISEKTGFDVVLIVIGDCHGDLKFTRDFAKHLKAKNTIHLSNSLKEVARSIAESKLFIGSSMHAFITALSYKTPAFLVLNNNPLHKFDGLLELCDLKRDVLCESFEVCYNRINHPALLNPIARKKIYAQLDKHWQHITEEFIQGVPTKENNIIGNYEKILLKSSNKKKSLLQKIKQKLKSKLKSYIGE